MRINPTRKAILLIGAVLLSGLLSYASGHYYAAAERDCQLARKMLVLRHAYAAIDPSSEKEKQPDKARKDCADYLGAYVAEYRAAQSSLVRRHLLRRNGSNENSMARRWDEIIAVAAKFGAEDPAKILPVP